MCPSTSPVAFFYNNLLNLVLLLSVDYNRVRLQVILQLAGQRVYSSKSESVDMKDVMDTAGGVKSDAIEADNFSNSVFSCPLVKLLV